MIMNGYRAPMTMRKILITSSNGPFVSKWDGKTHGFTWNTKGTASHSNKTWSAVPMLLGKQALYKMKDQCPLERAGVIKSFTVSAIMGSMDFDVLWACVQEFDAHYEVHRWSCRISKKESKHAWIRY